MQETSKKNKENSGMGTFAGVFTPSILTILGIILFLRLGYVVGSSGLWQALIIIGLAVRLANLSQELIALAAKAAQGEASQEDIEQWEKGLAQATEYFLPNKG